MSTIKLSPDSARQVENFRQSLFAEAQNLFSTFIPLKITQLDALLKDDLLNITDMKQLRAPLDIPIPDPPSPEGEKMDTEKTEEEEKKKAQCGFIEGNEKITLALERVKPEIVALRKTIITVSNWIQHLIPKIEDGNDFGVAVQEKILERIVAVKTKVEGFQTTINKYFSERGDAVAKASKETHVMDYRSQVHQIDVSFYSEIRIILLDMRGYYAEFYDIVINKNLEKVTNPKGEEKPPMY